MDLSQGNRTGSKGFLEEVSNGQKNSALPGFPLASHALNR
jgi:hypothetical protein